jgi:TPR repeat protein
MGYHYEWGYAVELNTEVALEWYRLAAAQGNEDAIESVQYLLEDAGLADS